MMNKYSVVELMAVFLFFFIAIGLIQFTVF